MQTDKDVNSGLETDRANSLVAIKLLLDEFNPVGLAEFVRIFEKILQVREDVTIDEYFGVLNTSGRKVRIVNDFLPPEGSGLRHLLQQIVSGREAAIKRRIDAEEHRRDVLEAKNRHPNFPDSDSYEFVRKFVERFGKSPPQSDFDKLRTLLSQKGHSLRSGELQYFLDHESKRQYGSNLRSRIIEQNPKTLRDVFETYLNFYEVENELAVNYLKKVLSELGFPYAGADEIKKDLKVIIADLEIKSFEASLISASPEITLDEIDCFDGYQFERFLQELYSKMGYKVEHTKLSGDQGADLVVTKFGEKTVIQAKCYSGNVGNYAVQEIFAALNLYHANKGVVITNSYFTPSAYELAHANKVELVDRSQLKALIGKYW